MDKTWDDEEHFENVRRSAKGWRNSGSIDCLVWLRVCVRRWKRERTAAVGLGQLPSRNELGQDGVTALSLPPSLSRGRFCIMRETTYGCRSDLHCYSRVFAPSWKERLRFFEQYRIFSSRFIETFYFSTLVSFYNFFLSLFLKFSNRLINHFLEPCCVRSFHDLRSTDIRNLNCNKSFE